MYKNRKSYYKNGGSYKKGNNFEKSKSKLGTNPVDSDGIIMRCHNCDSTKHFESNCPHWKLEETNMTVHITLVTGIDVSWTGNMLVESLGKGILDSTCTKTVSGEKWMDEYIRNLNEEDKKEVVCSETEKAFWKYAANLQENTHAEVWFQ